MELIKKIHRHSIAALIPLALISSFIEWKKLPAGILLGGLLGLVNIKGLAWGVQGLFGSHKANAKMVFFSMFRLFLLCIIIVVVAYLKLVNIFGILIGFTVIFTFVIIDGLKLSKNL